MYKYNTEKDLFVELNLFLKISKPVYIYIQYTLEVMLNSTSVVL